MFNQKKTKKQKTSLSTHIIFVVHKTFTELHPVWMVDELYEAILCPDLLQLFWRMLQLCFAVNLGTSPDSPDCMTASR